MGDMATAPANTEQPTADRGTEQPAADRGTAESEPARAAGTTKPTRRERKAAKRDRRELKRATSERSDAAADTTKPTRRERKAAKRDRRELKRATSERPGAAAVSIPAPGTEPAGDVADVVRLTDVRKTYGGRRNPVVALDGVTVGFRRGTFTAVMGPSGSGKSTFLHCAAGLDQPTSGSMVLDGDELMGMGEVDLTRLRRERIGFVFQAFNLLPALTVLENVTLPLRLAGRRPDRTAVADVIARVGLTDRVRHRPAELSGGQQQRVAIARAMVTRPAVIFGDEPTGALDTRTSLEVLGLLRESVSRFGQTVIIVTHDPVAAAHADRVVFLADGQVAGELYRPTADAVAERMTHLGAWAAPEPVRPGDPAAGAAAAEPAAAGVPGGPRSEA